MRMQFDSLQDSMTRTARATEESFRRMSVPDLIAALEQAALRGREPFNAPAFREITKRNDAAAPLAAAIKDSTQKEYFKLMALKALSADSYARIPAEQGAAILTDALAKSETFNQWGIPAHYWESSARAIIEYGPAATPRLERLLDDKRPAPMWGSEEVAIYEQFQFRVCDYALALLYSINRGDLAPLRAAPQARDSLIAAYKARRR